MHPLTKRSLLLIGSLLITFAALRVSLYLSPNSNFDVAGYNIHHLYTGIVLLVLAVIPMLLLHLKTRLLDVLMIAFGAGLSLILDEWVYLIATDGSDAAYLTPVSFWGGIVAIGLTSLYIAIITWIARRQARSPQ